MNGGLKRQFIEKEQFRNRGLHMRSPKPLGGSGYEVVDSKGGLWHLCIWDKNCTYIGNLFYILYIYIYTHLYTHISPYLHSKNMWTSSITSCRTLHQKTVARFTQQPLERRHADHRSRWQEVLTFQWKTSVENSRCDVKFHELETLETRVSKAKRLNKMGGTFLFCWFSRLWEKILGMKSLENWTQESATTFFSISTSRGPGIKSLGGFGKCVDLFLYKKMEDSRIWLGWVGWVGR